MAEYENNRKSFTTDQLETVVFLNENLSEESVSANTIKGHIKREIHCEFNKELNEYRCTIKDKLASKIIRQDSIIRACSVAYSLQDSIITKK